MQFFRKNFSKNNESDNGNKRKDISLPSPAFNKKQIKTGPNKENEKIININNAREEGIYHQNKTSDNTYPIPTTNEKIENKIPLKTMQSSKKDNSEKDDPEMVNILKKCYKKDRKMLGGILQNKEVYSEVRREVFQDLKKEHIEGKIRSFTI